MTTERMGTFITKTRSFLEFIITYQSKIMNRKLVLPQTFLDAMCIPEFCSRLIHCSVEKKRTLLQFVLYSVLYDWHDSPVR